MAQAEPDKHETPENHEESAEKADDQEVRHDPQAFERLRDELAGGPGSENSGDGPDVHDLQQRARSLMTDEESPDAAVADGSADPQDVLDDSWSPRKRLLFIVAASTACWVLILLPVLL